MSHEPYRVLDLFSGIGGFSLGLERTGGFRAVAFCESDEFARAVLAKHWPGVPCYLDVRLLTAEQLRADGIWPIDVICGGFPCQDISLAGRGEGIDGERSALWSEFARLIGEIRPQYVIVENVAALAIRGLGRVLGDLAGRGFDAEWRIVSASDVGAPHLRKRLWIVAYPSTVPVANAHKPRLEGFRRLLERARERSAWSDGRPLENGRLVKPGLRLLAHGVPRRVDQLRCFGNAVVPQIPEAFGRAILQAEGRL